MTSLIHHHEITSLKPDEVCDLCNGCGMLETESEGWGDVNHEANVCSECGGTGLSLLWRIMAGLEKPEPWPTELDNAMATPVMLATFLQAA